MAGVTGTNGKTTCAWLLAPALEAAARAAAYLGTLGTGRPRAQVASALDDRRSVHRAAHARAARAGGAAHVAMEVSSHALDQPRVDGVRFRVAAFSNLTRDHLDYHGTMERYAEAKARLFRRPGSSTRVINVGDPFGAQLACVRAAAPASIVTAAAAARRARGRGFVHVCTSSCRRRGIELEIDPSGHFGAAPALALIGGFNAENLSPSRRVLLAWQFGVGRCARARSARVHGAPGRMEASGCRRRRSRSSTTRTRPTRSRRRSRAARAHCARPPALSCSAAAASATPASAR